MNQFSNATSQRDAATMNATTPFLLPTSNSTNQSSADADAVPREVSASRDADLSLQPTGDHTDLTDAVRDSTEPPTVPDASTIDARKTTPAEDPSMLPTDARKTDHAEAHTVLVVSGEDKISA